MPSTPPSPEGGKSSAPPLALYVHLPWCVRKCPYCDFNSHVAPGALPQRAYLAALLADLHQELARAPGRPLRSVFIGGGTPSLFAPEVIAELLGHIRAHARLPASAEITLEANPGTLETGRLAGFRAAGVTRVSLGVQSFDNDALQALGRIHSADAARQAAQAAHAAGFHSWNLDLMYGLPRQNPQSALADIEAALALRPPHLSYYQLTLEPGTAFAHRPPTLPDADTVHAVERAAHARLRAAGYRRYEVSAWAQPGQRCAHNLNYWRFGDYLGIGAGAHGKLTTPAGITRRAKCRSPDSYLARAVRDGAVEQEHTVAPTDAAFEFLLNALRLTGGFSPALFRARTGANLDTLLDVLEGQRARGLLHLGKAVRATPLGYRMLDSVLAGLLPEAPPEAFRGAA